MTNPETIAAIQAWQADGRVQPLICRNESHHRKLEPFNDGGIVVLRCRDCGYRQTSLPDMVLHFSAD